MGIQERRARQKQVLRQAILDAASQLFIEQGYQFVSIRKIAKRIEYAPSTIYLYFKDKTDLLNAICLETLEQLEKSLRQVDEAPDEPGGKLRRGLNAYIDFGLAHPNHYLLTFSLPAPKDQQPGSPLPPGLRCFELLRTNLGNWIQIRNPARSDDVEAVAQIVWMFIHGVTALLITSHPGAGFPWLPRERLVDTAVDLIVKACNPAPPSRA